MIGLVFDHTALSALGRGHRLVAQLVDAAHREPDRHVYVPALCLAAAVAERPAVADHVGALPAVEVVELGYAAAAAVGALVATGVRWQTAQAIDAGRPSVDWPTGLPILTAAPEQYAGRGVHVITLS